MNDQLDAEQLVYLADDRALYLTSDKGYKKVDSASQGRRIWIEKPSELMTAEGALATLERMIS